MALKVLQPKRHDGRVTRAHHVTCIQYRLQNRAESCTSRIPKTETQAVMHYLNLEQTQTKSLSHILYICLMEAVL